MDSDQFQDILRFSILESSIGQRLDRFLVNQLDIARLDMSRERLKQLILEGCVTVNNYPQLKPSTKLMQDDIVVLSIPHATPLDLEAEDIPLSIVFEDDHMLVVDKPRGMLTHPTPREITGTLVNALLFHCKDRLSEINGVIRPGIVHRLDRDTSGLLMVAKTNQAHHHLAGQIKEKTARREYQAIIQGVFKEKAGILLQNLKIPIA